MNSRTKRDVFAEITEGFDALAEERAGKRTLVETGVVQCSAEESKALVASLAEPFRPNERLARAINRHETEDL